VVLRAQIATRHHLLKLLNAFLSGDDISPRVTCQRRLSSFRRRVVANDEYTEMTDREKTEEQNDERRDINASSQPRFMQNLLLATPLSHLCGSSRGSMWFYNRRKSQTYREDCE